MKTIKRRILAPLLTMIVLLPLTILLFFNIAVEVYIERSARVELENTFRTMRVLVERQLMDAVTKPAGDGQAADVLASLSAALTAAKFTANTQFFVFDAQGEPVFPRDLSGTPMTGRLLREVRDRLDNGGEISRVRADGGERFLMASGRMSGLRDGAPYLVFIAGMNAARGMIRAVNVILIVIIFVAVLVGTLIAAIVSRGISRPIQDACGYAKKISGGEFVEVPVDGGSREISEFCESVNEMSHRLEAYDTAQKTFLQDASHELRTPLMSIQGYAEGILSGVFEDNTRAAAIICDESKRLNTLVEELLTLSRIENQTYRGMLETANLGNLLREYAQRINGFALRERKQLVLSIADTPVYAAVDDDLLSQAVVNVLSNCIRYAKQTVSLSLAREGGEAVVTIRDDGPGIAQAELPHLFERFYKGKNGNFGLGLAIAKSAVEYMGGEVRARSDHGAVFALRLPAAESGAEKTR